ncbi:Pyridoxamine 5'-phosphate oxidase [Frankia sp. EI5c]|uniref:pyridoxamine 5'-phosphate oxidase family protein n=1 Tax=Frankia sp. EI5c TaxID=683316 RepID=UPI0007C20C70|nr:pyridoxamine 5'-phosphate oxidase family protein [Frankia sp. EI5c]OAA25441.1 Pyridoxamine 5'-phosphate oxidase [Frankia sp. EI5c]
MTIDLGGRGSAFLDFWRERHLCTLSTVRPDGTVHVVPVGVTLEPAAGLARVITRRGSRKVALVAGRGGDSLGEQAVGPHPEPMAVGDESPASSPDLSEMTSRSGMLPAPLGVPVTVCQVDGGRWSTLEGLAVVRDDPAAVAEAVRRYAERYRVPRPNPERVVLEILVTRVLGSV